MCILYIYWKRKYLPIYHNGICFFYSCFRCFRRGFGCRYNNFVTDFRLNHSPQSNLSFFEADFVIQKKTGTFWQYQIIQHSSCFCYVYIYIYIQTKLCERTTLNLTHNVCAVRKEETRNWSTRSLLLFSFSFWLSICMWLCVRVSGHRHIFWNYKI